MPPSVLNHCPVSDDSALASVDAAGSLSAVLNDYLTTTGCSKQDLLAALKIHAVRLEKELSVTHTTGSAAGGGTPATVSPESLKMYASPNHDPGLKDRFNGAFEAELKEKMGEKMTNLQKVPNEGQVVSQYTDHPAATELFQIKAAFRLDDRPRNYCLIMEDMEQAYAQWVDYVEPNCLKLLETFRKHKLPVVWSSWSRRPDDGMHGALDRFYGPRGVVGEHGNTNPCYVYGTDGAHCLESLAPVNDDEWSCYIQSCHLSKFADLDAEGREILYPLLEAWGVNTVIVVGAWTDDCIAATLFEGFDRYGYDMVLVSDGVATATVNGNKMAECLSGACCVVNTADEICQILDDHPELVEKPQAPLRGDTRFLAENQSR